MALSPIPGPAFRSRTFSNIQPFTYEDGLTVAETISRWLKYFSETVLPAINQGIPGEIDRLEALIADLQAQVDSNDVDIIAVNVRIDDLADMVQSIIDNSIEAQDPVVAGLIADDLSDTFQALRARFVQIDSLVINVADHGVVGDGVTNDTVALQAVHDAAPEWSRIWAPAGYEMLVDNLTVTKNIILDFSQAKVLRNLDGVVTIDVMGDWSNTTAVTGVGTAERYSTLSVADSSGFTSGDIVKVYSDDAIPFDRAGEQGGLMGELMRVDTVPNATSIRLAGKLLDTMATNVRVSKMEHISPTILIGDGDFTPEGGGLAPFTGRAFVQFLGTAHARADIRLTRSPHAAVSVRSCYENEVKLNLGWAPEADGYGITDGASKGCDYDITTWSCRHSFTDNTGRRGNITGSIYGYGRSMFLRIKVLHNGGTKNGSGIDTHSASYGHHFYDSMVSGNVESAGQVGNNAAYTIRSGNHTFMNCSAQGVENGFTVWSEGNNLTTGVRLIGCSVRDAMFPLDIRVRGNVTQHWADNPGLDLVIDGGVYESTYGSVARFEGVRTYLNNPVFVYASTVAPVSTDNSGTNFVAFAASAHVRGSFVLDAMGVTEGAVGNAVVFAGQGTIPSNVSMELNFSPYLYGEITTIVSVNSMRGQVHVKTNSYPQRDIVGGFDANVAPGMQSYTLENRGRKFLSGGEFGPQRRGEDVVTVLRTANSDAVIIDTASEGVFEGQIVNLLNNVTSEFNVRVMNTGPFNIGKDVFIAPGESFAFMWFNGQWVRAMGSMSSDERSTVEGVA